MSKDPTTPKKTTVYLPVYEYAYFLYPYEHGLRLKSP